MKTAISIYEQKGNIAAAEMARRMLAQLQAAPEATGPR
jgi:hypothetical protein